jgi:hypothetical protein
VLTHVKVQAQVQGGGNAGPAAVARRDSYVMARQVPVANAAAIAVVTPPV